MLSCGDSDGDGPGCGSELILLLEIKSSFNCLPLFYRSFWTIGRTFWTSGRTAWTIAHTFWTSDRTVWTIGHTFWTSGFCPLLPISVDSICVDERIVPSSSTPTFEEHDDKGGTILPLSRSSKFLKSCLTRQKTVQDHQPEGDDSRAFLFGENSTFHGFDLSLQPKNDAMKHKLFETQPAPTPRTAISKELDLHSSITEKLHRISLEKDMRQIERHASTDNHRDNAEVQTPRSARRLKKLLSRHGTFDKDDEILISEATKPSPRRKEHSDQRASLDRNYQVERNKLDHLNSFDHKTEDNSQILRSPKNDRVSSKTFFSSNSKSSGDGSNLLLREPSPKREDTPIRLRDTSESETEDSESCPSSVILAYPHNGAGEVGASSVLQEVLRSLTPEQTPTNMNEALGIQPPTPRARSKSVEPKAAKRSTHSLQAKSKSKEDLSEHTKNSTQEKPRRSKSATSVIRAQSRIGSFPLTPSTIRSRSPTFTSSKEICQAVWEDWYLKRTAEINRKRRESVNKEKEKIEKEDEKKKDKKQDAELAFRAWKEKKQSWLQSKKSEWKKIEKNKEMKEKEKMEKTEISKKVFEKWKEGKDALLKEEKIKARNIEAKKANIAARNKRRKEGNSQKFFNIWKEQKDEEIRKKLRETMQKKFHETNLLSTQKLIKTQESNRLFEEWIEKKAREEEKNKIEHRRRLLLEIYNPKPAWCPLGRGKPVS